MKPAPLLLCALLATACRDAIDPLATARLEIVSGDQQTGSLGAPLTQPVVVRLLSSADEPLTGIALDWRVLEGGGAVDSVRTITDAQGTARMSWRLGDEPGAQSLHISSPTASTTARATGILQFASVAGGYHHSCGLDTSGLAYCWGGNLYGQLGNGSRTASVRPVPVAGRLKFRQLDLGWFHTCGVTVTGAAYCWGDNAAGQLGSAGAEAVMPRRVSTSESFTRVSAGYHHSCGVAQSGAAYCWGSDDLGQLGTAGQTAACTTPAAARCTTAPLQVAGERVFTEIAAGEFHTCGATAGGVAHCWGWNSDGQLGSNAAGGDIAAIPARVFGESLYQAIAAGSRHTCAVQTDGAVACWGRNGAGENGLDPFTSINVPVLLATTLRFERITAGETLSCGVAADQRAYCWGSELGNGSGMQSRFPELVTLPGGAPVRSLGAGWQHTCAVTAGEVWCWGSNSSFQLGVAGLGRSDSPLRVTF